MSKPMMKRTEKQRSKSIWIRNNYFLWLDIETENRIHIKLPISIWAFREIIEAIEQLLMLLVRFLPSSQSSDKKEKKISMVALLQMVVFCRLAFDTLTEMDKFSLVDIKTKDTKVHIRLL